MSRRRSLCPGVSTVRGELAEQEVVIVVVMVAPSVRLSNSIKVFLNGGHGRDSSGTYHRQGAKKRKGPKKTIREIV